MCHTDPLLCKEREISTKKQVSWEAIALCRRTAFSTRSVPICNKQVHCWLKYLATFSSETSVDSQRTTRRCILEDSPGLFVALTILDIKLETDEPQGSQSTSELELSLSCGRRPVDQFVLVSGSPLGFMTRFYPCVFFSDNCFVVLSVGTLSDERTGL
jgi:hypothetical protein